MFVIMAVSDDDMWAIGPFTNQRYAHELMLVLEAKYTSVTYCVQELLEPRAYDDDVLEAANG